mgnify:CR=1 FL=1
MSRDEMIERLVAHNHLECCDCLEYRHRLMQKEDEALKRRYIIEMGYWAVNDTEERLRRGEVEALFQELLQRHGTE